MAGLFTFKLLTAALLAVSPSSAQFSAATCGPIGGCINDPEKPCPTALPCSTVTDRKTIYPNNSTTTSTHWITHNHTLTITNTQLKFDVITIPGSTMGFCEVVTEVTETDPVVITVWNTATQTNHDYTTVEETVVSAVTWTSPVQSGCVSPTTAFPTSSQPPSNSQSSSSDRENTASDTSDRAADSTGSSTTEEQSVQPTPEEDDEFEL